MKFDLIAQRIICVGCSARDYVKQTLTRQAPDEKHPTFCAIDDEGGFWKLESTFLPEGWRDGAAGRPLCPACPDSAALPPPASPPPHTKVQPIPINASELPARVSGSMPAPVRHQIGAPIASNQPAAAGVARVTSGAMAAAAPPSRVSKSSIVPPPSATRITPNSVFTPMPASPSTRSNGEMPAAAQRVTQGRAMGGIEQQPEQLRQIVTAGKVDPR